MVFISDASGVIFRLNKTAVYSAEEVQEQIDQDGTPQYGRWLNVEIEDEPAFLLAPSELIEELQDLEASNGEVFEVTRAEKPGSEETDPWEVNLDRKSTDTQTRL